MSHKTYTWQLAGIDIFAQHWAAESAKATIALVHGMGEHSSRYGRFFAPFMNQLGFNVIAFDQLGHGKTKGKRGHCPGGYEAVLDTVDHLVAKAEEVFPDLPVFLYGHSMGANVVLNLAMRRNPKVAGVIASSPMLRLAFEPPAWKLFMGKRMQSIWPGFTERTGLDPHAISRIPEEVEDYMNDPLVHDKISAAFSIPFFEAGEWAIEHADQTKYPTLVFHGTGDRLTSHKGTEAFANNANDKVSFKLYPDAFHELHCEPEREEVLNDVANWINDLL